jgi:hypothetical protein
MPRSLALSFSFLAVLTARSRKNRLTSSNPFRFCKGALQTVGCYSRLSCTPVLALPRRTGLMFVFLNEPSTKQD